MAQGLFTAAETLTTIAAAQTLTVIGAIQGGLGLITAAALFAKGLELQSVRDANQAELNRFLALSNNLWRLSV